MRNFSGCRALDLRAQLVIHDSCNGTGTCARCAGKGSALVELADFPFGTDTATCEPCRGTGKCPCTRCGGLERAQRALELARDERARCHCICGPCASGVPTDRCQGCVVLGEIIEALGGTVE